MRPTRLRRPDRRQTILPAAQVRNARGLRRGKLRRSPANAGTGRTRPARPALLVSRLRIIGQIDATVAGAAGRRRILQIIQKSVPPSALGSPDTLDIVERTRIESPQLRVVLTHERQPTGSLGRTEHDLQEKRVEPGYDDLRNNRLRRPAGEDRRKTVASAGAGRYRTHQIFRRRNGKGRDRRRTVRGRLAGTSRSGGNRGRRRRHLVPVADPKQRTKTAVPV